LIGEELLSEFIYEDEKPDPEDGADYTYVPDPIKQSSDNVSTLETERMN